jgi:uncharacterized protein (DUF2235 family)
MSKNVLIFSDGTGQAGGLRPDQRLSNVYKLYRATRSGPDSPINPAEQIAFYDPGLGTISDAGGIRLNIVDKLLSIFGLATGMGITDNIIDCYAAILKHYRPGDRICLFGFSRGAYTARCVAGVLRLCGVPTQNANGGGLPTDGPALRQIAKEAVVDVYEHRFTAKKAERMSAREDMAAAFRDKYGSNGTEANTSNAAPAFIGVFDTVAALGAKGWRLSLLIVLVAATVAGFSALVGRILQVLFPLSYWPTSAFIFGACGLYLGLKLVRARWKASSYDMSLDPRTEYARHARAIDETRADFDVLGWGLSGDVKEQHRAHPPWLSQTWFAGNHSDIGGSYPEDESRLSDIALEWMLEQLTQRIPVKVDADKLKIWASADGMQHCEVQYSKEQWWRPTWHSKIRSIDPKAVLHSSVIERFSIPRVPHCRDLRPYRPEALKGHEKVAHYYSDEGKPA